MHSTDLIFFYTSTVNRMLSIIKFGPIKRIGLFLRGKTPQAHTLEWFLRYFNMLSYHIQGYQNQRKL
nr:unnamed protein product [Fasciola hepatica]